MKDCKDKSASWLAALYVFKVSWSDCSMRYIDDLDLECLEDRTKKMPAAINHDRFGSIPGNRWGAKRQCEFLLKVGPL